MDKKRGINSPNGHPKSSANEGAERRQRPRIYGAFPATVRGIDANGSAFEDSTVVQNVSSNGIYFKLPHQITMGNRLFVVFPFPTAASVNHPPQVAVRGLVRRLETPSDGAQGIGLSFDKYRLIEAR